MTAITASERSDSGRRSKSMKKIKAAYRNLRLARLAFQKKYPGKTVRDLNPACQKNPQ